MAGIATDGRLLTALAALREGYNVFPVTGASASRQRDAHDAAAQRMALAGAVPVTWWSLAAEFQLEPRFEQAPYRLQLMEEFLPAMAMSGRTFSACVVQGKLAVPAAGQETGTRPPTAFMATSYRK